MKWEEIRLDKIAKINMGQSPKSQFYNEEANGLPFFQGKTEFGEYYPTVRQYTSKTTKIAYVDDILFTVRAPVGELNIANQKSCIGRGLASIQAVNKEEQKFLYYLLKSNKETFTSKSTGAVYDSINGNDLKSSLLKVPVNVSDRIKIAKILSNYDDLIENNLKQIKLLEEKARLTYEEWFLRFRVDGVELEIDSESGLPFGWETNKFKNVLKFKTGKLNSNAVVEDGKYDFYTCAKEIFKTNTFTFDEEVVLLGGNNATGNFSLFYANGKFDVYQRTYVITSTIFPSVYIYFVIKNYLPFFKNISSGATTKFLTMQILNLMPIVKPSNEILDKFEKKIQPIFDRVLNLKLQNQNLKEARDILLPRLMTGVIEP